MKLLIKPKMSSRIVAYLPNFDAETYKGIQYGTPENYTHIIIGFIVPYHYYMGPDAQGAGCSTLCNISTGTYYDSESSKTADEITTEIISNLKEKNPNLKILFSLGGYLFDNLTKNLNGCYYECSDPTMDPLEYLYTGPNPSENGDCKISDQPAKDPSEYCVTVSASTVAETLIQKMEDFGIDGIDLDFENTKVYNDPSSSLYQDYLDFYIDLVQELRKQEPNIIISVTPQAPYVILGDAFPDAYTFHEKWFNDDVMSCIDFMNVQFYNNPPDDSDTTSDPSILLKNYESVAEKYGPEKVTFGMCIAREDAGVCTECAFGGIEGNIPNNECTDPTYRYNNFIKPLFDKYKPNFGGIMLWNTAGDVDGEFSDPFAQLFGLTPSPSTPAPSTPAPSTPSPSTPSPSTPSPSTPSPSTPSPSTPSPSTPSPSTPSPSTPSPSTPSPSTPSPSTPVPRSKSETPLSSTETIIIICLSLIGFLLVLLVLFLFMNF